MWNMNELLLYQCELSIDSEKHTEFLNYVLNKDKKYPERIYNLSPKKRDNQNMNFR